MRMSTVKRNEYYKAFDGRCAFCGREVFFRRFFVDRETDYPICPECREIKGDLNAENFRKRLVIAGKILGRMPDMVFEYERHGGKDGEMRLQKGKKERDGHHSRGM